MSSYHTGSNRLHRRERGVDARALGIGFFLEMQAPARVALAGEQDLVEPCRLADRVAALQQPHQRGRAQVAAAVDVAVLARHHVGQLAAVRGHAQALAQALEQLGTALLVADVARQHI